MRVAFISLHTSPAERAGTADAGGMNVLIRALATALQQAGAHVEFFTRRSSADQPATATLDDGAVDRRGARSGARGSFRSGGARRRGRYFTACAILCVREMSGRSPGV